MARDFGQSGSGKGAPGIVLGIVGILCAGVVVILAMTSLGTSADATGRSVAQTDAALENRIQVGNLALETEGVDLDGKPFKLTDYRGKVVMLDFWGHW